MKAPNLADKTVKVRAYMTDETFGYDYWAAKQFSAPENSKPAVLLICDTDAEAEILLKAFGGRA